MLFVRCFHHRTKHTQGKLSSMYPIIVLHGKFSFLSKKAFWGRGPRRGHLELTLLSRGGRKWLHCGPLRAWLWPCSEAKSPFQLQPGHGGPERGWHPSPEPGSLEAGGMGTTEGEHFLSLSPLVNPPLRLLARCAPPCPSGSFQATQCQCESAWEATGGCVVAGRWKGRFHCISSPLFILPAPGVRGAGETFTICL